LGDLDVLQVQGILVGKVVAYTGKLKKLEVMLSIEEAWKLALEHVPQPIDLFEFVLALTADQSVQENNSSEKPAELSHLLDFAVLARTLAAFELLKSPREDGRKCPRLIMELGSRAIEKVKALDEHLESTHFHGSCLRADVHVLIEHCHSDAKWAIDQAIRLWDSISSDQSPFFRFHQSYMNVSLNRKFFVTEDCEMGIGPADLNSGDQICALVGGRTPYIVRPIEGSLDE